MTEQEPSRLWRRTRWGVLALGAGLGAYLGNAAYESVWAKIQGQSGRAALHAALRHLPPERLIFFFGLTGCLGLHLLIRPQRIWSWLYRWRWLLGAGVFALGVVFEVHGSSLAMWSHYVSGADPDTLAPIFGVERPIRSDEWSVFTPLAFSQEFTGYAVFNDITRATPTNMLTVYAQPAWDLTTLCKPFFWGYLLFGTAKGLAWFWCGRLIGLFLIAFELFRLITHDHRRLALAGAALVAWSPVIQWWFAINGLVEMICAGAGMVLLVHLFLTTPHRRVKAISAVAFALAACAYLLTLYPAWQVPLAYVVVALLVWVVGRDWRAQLRRLGDLAYLALALVLAAAIAGHWYLVSQDAITAVANTVYPGEQLYLGGNGLASLFTWPANLPTAFVDVTNPSEEARFLGFFPLPQLLAIVYLARTRCRDGLVTCLAAVDLLLLAFQAFGLPSALAQLSLLYATKDGRVAVISSLVDVLLLIALAARRDRLVPTRSAARWALTGGPWPWSLEPSPSPPKSRLTTPGWMASCRPGG